MGPMNVAMTGVIGFHVYETVTDAMHPTWNGVLADAGAGAGPAGQTSVLLAGGAKLTVTFEGARPSEVAEDAAHALADHVGDPPELRSSTGMFSMQVTSVSAG